MSHQYIKNRDIIMFSFQPWDTGIGSNFKDMALELAKHNRVLFVNRALDRRSMMRDKADPKVHARLNSIKHGIGELNEIALNLWVHNPRVIVESINWIPVDYIHDYFNKLNNRRIAREIMKAAQQLRFKNILLINDNDFTRGFYLKEMLQVKEYIFYIRDYMLAVDFFKRHGVRLEPQLMRKCDMVVANSAYLAAYAKQYNANSFDIGQGCDLQPFQIEDAALPVDMKKLRKPIIGYVGFVSEVRLDEQVLLHLARSFPQYDIVLVGPVDDYFQESELNSFSNVHFLGRKPQEELPAYIFHFDICMNPQILNEVTIGNYPRKIDEYLAMGKPVVATHTEAMQMFAPYVFLCKTKEDYVTHVNNIMEDADLYNSSEQQKDRKGFAMSHTWDNSIGLMGDAYHGLVQERRTDGKVKSNK